MSFGGSVQSMITTLKTIPGQKGNRILIVVDCIQKNKIKDRSLKRKQLLRSWQRSKVRCLTRGRRTGLDYF